MINKYLSLNNLVGSVVLTLTRAKSFKNLSVRGYGKCQVKQCFLSILIGVACLKASFG